MGFSAPMWKLYECPNCYNRDYFSVNRYKHCTICRGPRQTRKMHIKEWIQ